MTPGPFHEGERLAQARAGQTAMAAKVGALVEDALADRARAFLADQELVVIAGEAPDGSVWVSPLFGRPGLVRAPSERELVLDRTEMALAPGEPLFAELREEGDLGILAIDFAARRRLRVNVRVGRVGGGEIRAAVREAYPNCPKFIQRRRHSPSPFAVAGDRRVYDGGSLDAERRGIIARADTCFVGSRHSLRGADASHRGGPPGFVRVIDERTLRIDDYAGNGMFNTLGNLLCYPRVGLSFIDFDRARVLWITGTSRVDFGPAEGAPTAAATGRSWQVTVSRWVEGPVPVDWRWERIAG